MVLLARAGEWWVLCSESKACGSPLSPLPSPPGADGVSSGPLMNIDTRGLGKQQGGTLVGPKPPKTGTKSKWPVDRVGRGV